uniref:TIL domain-containing protein n=1 Tax=Acrobeloides nanus TaxID=290746 RepID=A0A914EHQ0_9BILA
MKSEIFWCFITFYLLSCFVKAQNSTTSHPRCQRKEKWVQCGTCEPVCDNQEPICTMGSNMAALVCLPARCQCRKGFVRNNATGKCILRRQCSNINNLVRNPGGRMIPSNQRRNETHGKRQAPIACNCHRGLNCETLPCLIHPCPTRCNKPGGIPPVTGGNQFGDQGIPLVQFRQPGQLDQPEQVQQPGFQGFDAGGNPNKPNFNANPFLPVSGNVGNNNPSGQILNTGNSIWNSNGQ